jgi:rSAM/selenodomain-associated transferase 2
VVVVDGGSSDKTVALAGAWGARTIAAPRGRGRQLAAGGAAAAGTWLLFLHADTRLAPGWTEVARGFIADEQNGRRAGYFRLRLDDRAPAARRIERAAGWRARRLGLPYGDQGLLLAAALYRALGGFRPLPLMEDVDLVRRLGRARLAALPAEALTSAERYRRDGYVARPLRNLACLSLYFLGVPPRLLQHLY